MPVDQAMSLLIILSSAAEKSFVYGVAPPGSSLSQEIRTRHISPGIRDFPKEIIRDPKAVMTLSHNPDWLPWMSRDHRLLIHHFANKATGCFSLHSQMREAFCKTLLPLALDTSDGCHLLTSILLTSAIHRRTLGSYHDETQLIHLQGVCVQEMRRQTVGLNIVIDEKFAATALTLCVGEIMSGGAESGTWRVHLQGATAILSRLKKTQPDTQSSNITGRNLLLRWCKTFEVLSLLAGNKAWPPVARGESVFDLDDSVARPEEDHIDLFDGFSTSLYRIFHEISSLENEQNALNTLQSNSAEQRAAVELLQTSLFTRCERLARELQEMTKTRSCRLEAFIEAHTSIELKADFDALNESYHHAALLELYQRIMYRPPTDPAVRISVLAGIQSLKRITQFEDASPAVATLRSIFTIGCSALEETDRAFVVDWLAKMKRCFVMGNVDTVSSFLQEFWLRNDGLREEGDGAVLRWTELIGESFGTTVLVRGYMLTTTTEEKGWELSVY